MKSTVTRSSVFLSTCILVGWASSSLGGPIPPGPSGNYINNSAAAQNAQLNVGTATVRGTLTAGSLVVPTVTSPLVTATQFVGGGIGLTNLNPAEVKSGTIPASVVWHGGVISPLYGGTGQDWSAIAQGRIPYFSGIGVMSTIPAGVAGQVLQSGGPTGPPSFTGAPAVLGTNVTAIPVGNLSAGTLPANVVASSVALSGVVAGVYGGPTQSAQLTIGADGRVRVATQLPLPGLDPAIPGRLDALDVATGTLTTGLAAEVVRATAREDAIGVSTGSTYAALQSTGAALTAEIVRATARENAIGVSTSAIQEDLASEVSRATIRENAIAVSTGSIYSALQSTGAALTAETAARIAGDNALGVSTGSIYSALQSTGAALTAETVRAVARETAIGVSTGTNYAAINSTGAALTAETAARIAGDNALGVSTGSIYSALQSTGAALTAEVVARIAGDNALGVSTGSIYSALQSTGAALTAETAARIVGDNALGVSTGSIYSALQSTGAALTAETARATAREDAIILSTGAINLAKVNRAGDTITGALSITGNGGQFGLSVSSNVYIIGFSSAAKYYGDGSSLTGLSGAVLASTQTFTGSNTFTATGAGGTAISSATIITAVIPTITGATRIDGLVISTYSATAGGFTYLPGGVLMQWGGFSHAYNDATTGTLNFPKAFTVAPWVMLANPNNTLTTSLGVCQTNIQATSTTQFTYRIGNYASAATGCTSSTWIAIGR